MRKLLFIVFIFFSYFGYAQILPAADTFCAGTPVALSTADSSLSYAWDTTAINIGPPPINAVTTVTGGTYSGTYCVTMRYDNATGNFYAFDLNATGSNVLIRLDFGTNPTNVPTIGANLGTLGFLSNSCQYIDIVRDSTGLWYGFVTNGSNIVRLDFGTSLSNPTPIATAITVTGISKAVQITLIKYNGQWVAFFGNDGSGLGPNNITRLDFGANIKNTTPIETQLPAGSPAAFNNPQYFALYHDNAAGTWSMLVTTKGSGFSGSGLSRYDFGANLQNNTPTATLIGTLGGGFASPRGITIIESCDSFYALATCQGSGFTAGGHFAHLSFNNGTSTSITNTPTMTDLGTLFTGNSSTKSSLCAFWNPAGTVSDSLYIITSSFSTTSIYEFPVFGLSPGGGVVGYGVSSSSLHNYAAGTYNTAVLCDEGNQGHQGHYCKPITAVNPGPPALYPKDSTACQGDSLILFPSIAGNGTPSYLWSTGATTSSIVVKTNGLYYCTVTGAGLCTVGNTDSAIIQFVPKPAFILGKDTTICSGTPLTLKPLDTANFPPGLIYSWSTNATSSSISVNSTGSYSLTVINVSCPATASINVTAIPSPVVNLGNDTTFCQGYIEYITSSQPAGTSFLWSDGSHDSTLGISAQGTYWLSATYNGCTSTDTIVVKVTPAPTFNLGHDTTICDNIPLTIGATNPNATSYTWSVDSTLVVYYTASGNDSNYMRALNPLTDGYLTLTTGGIFSLTITVAGGCAFADTISIISQPGPHILFNIPRYDTICKTHPFTIDPGYHTGVSYLWNTGATSQKLDVNETGNYWVNVKNENGCSATDTVSIKMITVPQQGLLGNDTVLCNDQELMIPPFIDSTLSFVWYSYTNDAIQTYNNSQKSLYVKDAPGLYYASITNRCGTTIDSIYIQTKFCNIWFPNVFTPNSDGVNDIIKPLGDLSLITNYTLTVFDRWGTVLFTSTNPYDGWNGRFNNIPQPKGVYVYEMAFNYKNIPNKQKGNFTLIR